MALTLSPMEKRYSSSVTRQLGYGLTKPFLRGGASLKAFIHDDFILNSKVAEQLYHKYAENMPIFDYHCHLEPKEIFEDKRYSNLTEIWLGGDHYKWRLMRANGVDEKYITGNAEPYEKFLKWAETVPKTLGNPLYHWTHLELKRFFGIDELLSPKTALKIWEACNKKLAEKDFTARSLIVRSNVKALCTTDDPADDLKYHIELSKAEDFPVKVLPTFRPDRAFDLTNKGFAGYMSCLSKAAGMSISSFDELVGALKNRAEFFKSVGCLVSDIAFGNLDFTEGTPAEADKALKSIISGEAPSKHECDVYNTQLMLELGKIYNSLGFVMQIHMGAIRNNNSGMFERIGANTGFDAIGNCISADSLAALLNAMDRTNELPRTILYSLNDLDNAKIASIMGCFQGGGIAGKLQLGSAWWFNDHLDGMRYQLKTLGNIGLLSSFVGMLTDSRSFLSYPRHEYFRRILCDLLGEWVQRGEVPMDEELLGAMVEDICFNNVARYFGMNF
jgi:glucuronate isomerase